MKRWLIGLVVLLVIALVGIQFVPIERHNPPVALDIPTSPEVKAVLKQSCYDCHSHETVWPWYSRIAPVSWLVAKDVLAGRDELNFSTWDQYSVKEQVKKTHESWEEVAEGEMPPWFYIAAHRKASVSTGNRTVLREWARIARRPEHNGDHDGDKSSKKNDD